MINSTQLKNELETIGLSPSQAEIYLLVFTHHELRIQEIVNLAKIPRSSVYQNLKQLYSLGLAEEIIDNNYKRIRAYPIDSLRQHLDDQIRQIENLTTGLDQFQKTTATPSNMLASTQMRFYKDRAGARQLLWNTLKATDTIYVYSHWGRGQYVGMKFYENFVAESRIRKIKEKVLINPSERVISSIKTYTGKAISRANINNIRCLDQRDVLIIGETFIYDNVYAQVYLKNQSIDGFEIESHQFVATQRSIFETLWKTAQPVSAFL